jgi:HAD superfamily hydrolase (TIGR01509 family)
VLGNRQRRNGTVCGHGLISQARNNPILPVFDLIIFDCDGVLLESEIISCSTDAVELTKAGFPYTTEEVCEQFLGKSLKSMLATIEADHGKPLPNGFSDHLKRCNKERFEQKLVAVDGIEQVLDGLALPFCVASSSDVARLNHSLGLVGLHGRFAPHIYSADHVENAKPAPDLFLHAASCMGAVPDRCLVIEDSLAGVAAGLAAGMAVLGFHGGAHCPAGHGDRLTKAGTHRIFDRMVDLPALIGELG